MSHEKLLKPRISVDDFSMLPTPGGDSITPEKPVYRSVSSMDIPRKDEDGGGGAGGGGATRGEMSRASPRSPASTKCDNLLNPLISTRSTSCPSITDAQQLLVAPTPGGGGGAGQLSPYSSLSAKTSMLSLLVQAPDASSFDDDDQDTNASRDNVSDMYRSYAAVKVPPGCPLLDISDMKLTAPLATIEMFDDSQYEKCRRWLADLPSEADVPLDNISLAGSDT